MATAMPNFKSYLGNRPMRRDAPKDADVPRSELTTDTDLTEVLFETVAVGNSVKVSTIDPSTNIEVSVVGSTHMSPYSLKMNALRKLEAAIRKPNKG